MSSIRFSSLHTVRPPMSEARRQSIHGRLQPMLEDDNLWQPFHRGMVWLGLCFAPVFIAAGLVAVFGG